MALRTAAFWWASGELFPDLAAFEAKHFYCGVSVAALYLVIPHQCGSLLSGDLLGDHK